MKLSCSVETWFWLLKITRLQPSFCPQRRTPCSRWDSFVLTTSEWFKNISSCRFVFGQWKTKTVWEGYEIKLGKLVPNFSISGLLKKMPFVWKLWYLKFAFELLESTTPEQLLNHTFLVDLVIVRALYCRNISVVSVIIIFQTLLWSVSVILR